MLIFRIPLGPKIINEQYVNSVQGLWRRYIPKKRLDFALSVPPPNKQTYANLTHRGLKLDGAIGQGKICNSLKSENF